MKKTPIIAGVISLGIIGGAYLGGMYISSSKAMSTLHHLVERANVSPKKQVEIIEESKGLFTSKAHLVATDSENDAPIVVDAPLVLHHGLFSTDIDSKATITSNGQNLLQTAGANADKADLVAHLAHDETGRGSFVEMTVPGSFSTVNDDEKTQLTDMKLRLERVKSGALTLSSKAASVQGSDEDMNYSSGPMALSLTYDSAWVDNAIKAGQTYNQDETVQNEAAFYDAILSRLPDVHFELNDVTTKVSLAPEAQSKLIAFDVNRELGNAPVTRLDGRIEGIKGANSDGDVHLNLALDQVVIDTLLKITRQEAVLHGEGNEEREAQRTQQLIDMLKKSPRLMLEDLRVAIKDVDPIVANGALNVVGEKVTSEDDLGVSIFNGNVTITGLPKQAASLAEAYGLESIDPAKPIVLKLQDGHLFINDQQAF